MADSIKSTLHIHLKRKAIPQHNSTEAYSPVSPIEPDTVHSTGSTSIDKQETSPQVTSEGTFNRDPTEEKHIGWVSRKWQDWWIGELLSALVSFLSLMAIIVVLRRYDQKPLREWALPLSLNTYLAIFTTLAKAGLLFPAIICIGQLKWLWFAKRDAPLTDFGTFEEGARGPLGAAILIGRLRFWHLGSFGALITLLAIGISPITQQTIEYPSRLVPVITTLPCQVPSSRDWASTTGGARNQADSGTLNIPMRQALYSGFWTTTSDSINEIVPSCPTGNCTYPEYDSLAVCYKVANVTNQLKITQSDKIPLNFYNATLRNGNQLKYGAVITQINKTSSVVMENSTIGLTIGGLDVIYQTERESFNKINSTFNALEAVFWFCVNTYKTEVSNGFASTIVTKTSIKVDRPNLNGFQYFDWILPSGNTKFTVNNPSLVVLRNYLAKKLDGFFIGDMPGATVYASPFGDIALLVQPILEANTTDLVMEGFTNYTRNIANSMTNSIRTHQGYSGSLNSTFIPGTAFTSETFIHVRWAWLSLLCALTLLSFIFLLATIVQTAFSEVEGVRLEGMRSDSLAALTILGSETKEFMGPTALQKGTVERAEGLKVRLGRVEGGWCLNAMN